MITLHDRVRNLIKSSDGEVEQVLMSFMDFSLWCKEKNIEEGVVQKIRLGKEQNIDGIPIYVNSHNGPLGLRFKLTK